MDRHLNDILQIAKRIVLQAGNEARKVPLRSRAVLKSKPLGDIVTDGDLVVQDYVKEALEKEFPDYGFCSEEIDEEETGRGYEWLLDPIDGTKYYARGVPFYTVSLALKKDGEPVLGIVYGPELNRVYCASIEWGATQDGAEIQCSDVDSIEKASVYLEIPSKHSSDDEREEAMKEMALLVERAYRVRIIGVGSLGLCFCAAGSFDAYVNLGSGSKPCDTAAGEVIVQMAGGEYSKAGNQIIAGPARLCREIRDLLNT